MHSIADFINPAAALNQATTVGEAQDLLAQARDRHVLAIAEDGRPAGLVTREAALAADPQQRLGEIMDGAPLTLEAGLDVLDACRRVAMDVGRAHDGFLICEDGLCVGAGSLRALLEGLYNTHRADPIGLAVAATAHEELSETPYRRRIIEMIGQELRTPLDSVLAMTECLERQPLAADAQSQVRAIRESGEALLRITTAAIDLTRAEEGLLETTPAPMILRALIDDVQSAWAPRAAREGVNLLISFDGDPELAAMGDRVRLHQVFDHLIESALQDTREGSVEIGLKVRAEGDGVRVEGRVRDTGPGLPPEKLARVFEPSALGGCGGLGLSLARHIILTMHGCIRAESNAGIGVSVIFDLFCQAAPRAVEASLCADPVGATGAHILVVDDNATNRMVAEALCEMFDCTSECAVDGVEAVEIAQSGRFDLILMDIKMPRMDGIAATRAIRALPGRAGSAPIIALTANADPEDARAYLASGMCDVVEKPIKPERLLAAINAALASSTQTPAEPLAAPAIRTVAA